MLVCSHIIKLHTAPTPEFAKRIVVAKFAFGQKLCFQVDREHEWVTHFRNVFLSIDDNAREAAMGNLLGNQGAALIKAAREGNLRDLNNVLNSAKDQKALLNATNTCKSFFIISL